MIKLFFLTISLMLAVSQPPNLEEHYSNDTWEVLLHDVRMRYRFSVEYNSFVHVPRFGDKIREKEGAEITLRGFFLPADVTGEAFVLSYVPMQMCFFCAGAGIESVVELHSLLTHQIRFRRLNTDDFIEVRGKLRLNRNDLDHLIYILDDAELLQVIK
ncbi:MAG: hypothetical protein EA361_15025 [Bacteroidetes bacterium]|nr:MAG: hypothetical protein EA361_15025 [Bacteroidota bacterium]